MRTAMPNADTRTAAAALAAGAPRASVPGCAARGGLPRPRRGTCTPGTLPSTVRPAAPVLPRLQMSVLPVLAAGLLVLAAGLLAGCRSVTPTQGLPGAQCGSHAFKQLRSDLRAFEGAMQRAAGDRERLELVGAILKTVENWCAANPGAPARDRAYAAEVLDNLTRTRTRLTFFVARDAVHSRRRDAATRSDYREALDQELSLTRAARQSGAFSPAECEDFDLQCNLLQTALDRMQVEDAMMTVSQISHQPESYAQLRDLCDTTLARLREHLGKPYWPDTDREWLRECIAEVQTIADQAEKELNAFIQQVNSEIEQAQKLMVNKTAKKDYQQARSLYEAELHKWFNWAVLGHPRDNTDNLVMVLLFCDRVRAEERVDYPLRQAASRLHSDVMGRFDREQKARYANVPRLPPYTALKEYPRNCPGEVRARAKKRWLFYRRHPASETLVEQPSQEDTL